MMPSNQNQALPKLPDSTPQAPVFSSNPVGSKPGRKPQTPAYLPPSAGAASPSVANAGYKQLIGQ
jgi:hypothetical protein